VHALGKVVAFKAEQTKRTYMVAQKTGTLVRFVRLKLIRLKFVIYWPILKIISLSESGEYL